MPCWVSCIERAMQTWNSLAVSMRYSTSKHACMSEKKERWYCKRREHAERTSREQIRIIIMILIRDEMRDSRARYGRWWSLSPSLSKICSIFSSNTTQVNTRIISWSTTAYHSINEKDQQRYERWRDSSSQMSQKHSNLISKVTARNRQNTTKYRQNTSRTKQNMQSMMQSLTAQEQNNKSASDV